MACVQVACVPVAYVLEASDPADREMAGHASVARLETAESAAAAACVARWAGIEEGKAVPLVAPLVAPLADVPWVGDRAAVETAEDARTDQMAADLGTVAEDDRDPAGQALPCTDWQSDPFSDSDST
jgi:hypothetical protein